MNKDALCPLILNRKINKSNGVMVRRYRINYVFEKFHKRWQLELEELKY